jgi:hypothetical protein
MGTILPVWLSQTGKQYSTGELEISALDFCGIRSKPKTFQSSKPPLTKHFKNKKLIPENFWTKIGLNFSTLF